MQFDLSNLSDKKVFLLLLLLGFILYGNTLTHQFALDDAIAITENDFTKEGFSGIWKQLTNDQFVGFYGVKKELVSGGRYRPLSMILFNIQYGIFGENAFVGHLTNVLFYILNGFLLFLVLKRLLRNFEQEKTTISFPLLATLLWFFHPIHTEVVANIKGLDEIMAFSFVLITLLSLLLFLDKKQNSYLFLSGFAYLLALLSKESAVTWLAILPLSLYFFTKHEIKKSSRALLVIFGVAVAWFFIRLEIVGGGISSVADNIMNDPFLESTVSEKYATIMLTLGKYIQLLIFPHPLTYDYYPKHIPIVNWKHPLVILSCFSYLLLIYFAIKGFLKKRFYSFCILFFLITLSIASNIVFSIGAFMNERFVYVSSLGLSLLIAYWFIKYSSALNQKRSMLFSGVLILMFSLYSIKTISRNLVWENNFTLATHDANISVNGAKSNVMAGGILSEEAVKLKDPVAKKRMLEKAIFHLNRSLRVYPEYIDALILMGNAQWQLTENPKNVIPYYQEVIAINPYHENSWKNLLIVLEQSKDIDYKIQTYQTLLRYNPNKEEIYLNLGRAFGKEKNDLTNSKKYLEQALAIAPNNHEVLTNLGTLYGLQKEFKNAINVLEKAVQLQPSIAKTYVDLGLSYYYFGQAEKARKAFDKAVQLDATLNRSQFPI